MSSGFSNPLVGGGGGLVYPSIHSPGFVTGVTGWSINKNGTAEFNSLIIRNGTIISGLFLLYSSAIPAKGNLVVAFAPIAGGTDAVGNVYPQGFNWGVWNAGGALVQHFGIDINGNISLANNTGKTIMYGQSSDGTLIFYTPAGAGAGNLAIAIAPAAGTDPFGNVYGIGMESVPSITTLGQFNGQKFVAFQPATTNSETWHNATLNPANFTVNAAYAPVGYQFEGINGGRVRLRGQVVLASNQGGATTIFTLPAGYQPVNLQAFTVPNSLNGGLNNLYSVQVNGAGSVQMVPAGITGNFVQLDGIVIELD
jgi:hypothetical protein